MINYDDDSLARTAHALGITTAEYRKRLEFSAPNSLGLPPPAVPQVESSPEDLDDWILQDILSGEFDDLIDK